MLTGNTANSRHTQDRKLPVSGSREDEAGGSEDGLDGLGTVQTKQTLRTIQCKHCKHVLKPSAKLPNSRRPKRRQQSSHNNYCRSLHRNIQTPQDQFKATAIPGRSFPPGQIHRNSSSCRVALKGQNLTSCLWSTFRTSARICKTPPLPG